MPRQQRTRIASDTARATPMPMTAASRQRAARTAPPSIYQDSHYQERQKQQGQREERTANRDAEE